MPAFVMRHGRVQDPEEQMAACNHFREEIEIRLKASRSRLSSVLSGKVESVDLLPHLQRDVLACNTRIFAGRHDRRQNRVGISGIECKELDHIAFGSAVIVFRKKCLIAGGADERTPLFLVTVWKIQAEPCVDIDEPGNVFSTLDVSAHPIE